MTPQDLLAHHDDRINEFGFSIVAVEPDPDHPPWAYTIGLVELGHPEVALLGTPLDHAFALLQSIGEQVAEGRRYQPGDVVRVDDEIHFHVDEVDDGLWDGPMFNLWLGYYAWRGDIDAEPWAVELVPCGGRPQPIDPNRSARRAQQQLRRRRR